MNNAVQIPTRQTAFKADFQRIARSEVRYV